MQIPSRRLRLWRPLHAIIETLSGELKAARATNDVMRDQLAAAQAESAELKGKSAATEAALEREVFDRRALQQQADHGRRNDRPRRSVSPKFKPTCSTNNAVCRLLKTW